jgi:frataxin-like iron-binding protein CyaY
MMKRFIVTLTLIAFASFSKAAILPAWFTKAFSEQKFNIKYAIIGQAKATFLKADFNGDHTEDIVVQIIDIKTKKKGLLIINGQSNKSFVFGAGAKFKGESFDNTNWLKGWRLYKDKVAYETVFNPDGDIIGGKKIHIKYLAIYAYGLEDGEETAGVLIYWNGTNYISIHQGE